MIVLKPAPMAAVLAASLLFVGTSTHAETARQYAFQGQGLYLTSKGVPEGFIAIPPAGQKGVYGDTVANPPRDLEHHGRYFGGN